MVNKVLVETKDLTKEFPTKSGSFGKNKATVHAVTDVNLQIFEGETLGVVGESGCGKSTLGRVILHLHERTSGKILFNGEDTFKTPAVRKDIFFVSDEPYYPIAANIRTMKEFYSPFYDVDMKTYNEVLNLFHLDDTKPISSFSKGMKRQASLLYAGMRARRPSSLKTRPGTTVCRTAWRR